MIGRFFGTDDHATQYPELIRWRIALVTVPKGPPIGCILVSLTSLPIGESALQRNPERQASRRRAAVNRWKTGPQGAPTSGVARGARSSHPRAQSMPRCRLRGLEGVQLGDDARGRQPSPFFATYNNGIRSRMFMRSATRIFSSHPVDHL
jgi:hypothetical protein